MRQDGPGRHTDGRRTCRGVENAIDAGWRMRLMRQIDAGRMDVGVSASRTDGRTDGGVHCEVEACARACFYSLRPRSRRVARGPRTGPDTH
eukprot:4714123-Prymnesium_polylepis.1